MKKFLRRMSIIIAAFLYGYTSAGQGNAQERLTRNSMVDNFFEASFEVLKADTTIKDGLYKLSHHGTAIEEGMYRNGRRVGIWKFRNLQKMVELKYDYDRQSPTYVLPHMGYKYDQKNNPCIFLGSPVVPFYCITNRVYYPKAEANRKTGGEVVLRLKIDTQGKIAGVMIKKSTSEAFADVVRKAAAHIPKDKWRWIPAKENGKRINGNYDITILFENE